MALSVIVLLCVFFVLTGCCIPLVINLFYSYKSRGRSAKALLFLGLKYFGMLLAVLILASIVSMLILGGMGHLSY